MVCLSPLMSGVSTGRMTHWPGASFLTCLGVTLPASWDLQYTWPVHGSSQAAGLSGLQSVPANKAEAALPFFTQPWKAGSVIPTSFHWSQASHKPTQFKGRGQRPYLSVGGVSRSHCGWGDIVGAIFELSTLPSLPRPASLRPHQLLTHASLQASAEATLHQGACPDCLTRPPA